MMLGLSGKVALVTGGTKGIGRAIAEMLASEGASVIVCARNINKKSGYPGLFPIKADVRRQGDIKKLIRTIIYKYSKIDILVNNAGGVDELENFENTQVSNWVKSFEQNLIGVVIVTKFALQYIRKSKSGRIINISSELGKQPGGFAPHYCAMKAAVINLSKYLANELASDRITVNTVCPGPVLTDSWEREVNYNKKVLDKIVKDATKRVPIGRIGEPVDVAGLVAFLASEKASWITGACLSVDGGAVRGIF